MSLILKVCLRLYFCGYWKSAAVNSQFLRNAAMTFSLIILLAGLIHVYAFIHRIILPCHCFVLIVVAHAQGAGMFSHLIQPVHVVVLQGTYSSVGAILFHPQQYIFILFSLWLPTITWLIGWSKEIFFTFCPLNPKNGRAGSIKYENNSLIIYS